MIVRYEQNIGVLTLSKLAIFVLSTTLAVNMTVISRSTKKKKKKMIVVENGLQKMPIWSVFFSFELKLKTV